jgi:hypothetical protein
MLAVTGSLDEVCDKVCDLSFPCLYHQLYPEKDLLHIPPAKQANT